MKLGSTQTRKPRWLRWLGGLVLLVMLVVSGLLSVLFFAPGLLEPWVLKKLRQQGLQLESVGLHKLRPTHAEFTLTGIDLGKAKAIHLPLRTTHNLGELIQRGRVQSIHSNGAKLSIHLQPAEDDPDLPIPERIANLLDTLPETLPFDTASITEAELTLLPTNDKVAAMTQRIQATLTQDGNLQLDCPDLKATAHIRPRDKELDLHLEAHPDKTLTWLKFLDQHPDNLLEIDGAQIKATLRFRNDRFEHAEATLLIPALQSKEADIENLSAHATFDPALAPTSLQANATLKKLHTEGYTTAPVPVSLQWASTGQLAIGLGPTTIQKPDALQATLSNGKLTAQLGPDHKPVSWHWKATHPSVSLPHAKLHLANVQVDKDFDGQQLSVAVLAETADYDDLPFGNARITAEAAGMELHIQGEVQFGGTKVPFQADGTHPAIPKLLQLATTLKKPDKDALPAPEQILSALNFSAGPVELVESPLLNTLPTGLPEATLSGTFDLQGNLGKRTFTFQAEQADLHIPEHNLRASGIQTTLRLHTHPTPHTPEAATLQIRNIRLNQLELHDGELPITLLDNGILRTPGGAFKTLGGTLRLGPATLQPNGYDTLATGLLLLQDINFQQVLALTETPPLQLEGQFGGILPFRYARHELQLQSGTLQMNPGSTGRLQYDATGKFTTDAKPGSTQFEKMQFAERALQNLRLNDMKIQLFTEDSQGRPLPAKASIRGTYEEKNKKINLNLDLNLRGEVEKIIRNAAKGQLDLSF